MTTILCIEDEAALREGIVEELVDQNYTVLEASHGAEGLKMILEHHPDLVLCDINMPNMNGYELQSELRENYPQFAEMPFIFLTALADKARILEGLEKGADAYLTKPVDYDMMLLTVEANLRQMELIRSAREDHTMLDI